MHNIYVRIYVRLCHQSICDGPLIELSLVTYGLTHIVITIKKDGNVKKNYIHVITVYQTQQTLQIYQDGDKNEVMPLNIKSIHRNIIAPTGSEAPEHQEHPRKYQNPTRISENWQIKLR